MYYRNLHILIIILAALTLFSCESPEDVDANRRYLNDDPAEGGGGKGGQHLYIDKKVLKFNEISYKSTFVEEIVLVNTAENMTVKIDKIELKNDDEFFSLIDLRTPLELAPNMEEGSSKHIAVKFSAVKLGYFQNILNINDNPDLQVKLEANVPTVKAIDLDIGTAVIDFIVSKPMKIRNHGTKEVFVQSCRIIQGEGVFSRRTSFPKKIPAGEEISVIFSFAPKAARDYKAEVIFEIINAQGIVDNKAVLRGKGLK